MCSDQSRVVPLLWLFILSAEECDCARRLKLVETVRFDKLLKRTLGTELLNITNFSFTNEGKS